VAPRVTRLRERRGGRVLVELDGREWRAFPAEVVVHSGLREGKRLDREQLRRLARERRRAHALAAAARVLRPRDLSRAALEGRLERAGVQARDRAEALGTLTRAGLVDDERFAGNRVRALAERGYGDAAIRHDLEHQGIPRGLIDPALARLDPEPARAERIAAARGRTAATARHLARKGFGEDSIEAVVAPEP
jgi:SOS response regulatory protein OraA/RecX